MSNKWGWGLLFLLALVSSARAQTGSPTPETTVTVKGKKPKVERKIDRTVYDQSQTPAAQSGSAADVLKTVPSVSVTPDGDVALRGDKNVQVYINGKPAAEMAPDMRAVTLQAMAGSDIASVEVITNPSAAYNANGGGIINIVLKKIRKPGLTGAMIANVGNMARDNVNLTGAWNKGKLSLNGRIGFRHDLSGQVKGSDLIWTDHATSQTGRNTQHSRTPARRFSQSAQAGLGYALGEADDLNASLTWTQNQARNGVDEFHQDFDAIGLLINDYDRHSTGPRRQTNMAAQMDYDHLGTKSADELKLSLKHSQTINDRDKSFTNLFTLPVQDDVRERLFTRDSKRLDEISLDYVRPLDGNTQVSAGADVQHEQSRFYNYKAVIDPLSGSETVDGLSTNRFVVDQSLNAAYLTLQTAQGKWTVLGGLRLETLNTHATQITMGSARSHPNAHLNPSLHISYTLDAIRQLKASFSDSLQRPAPADLNPFIVYLDAQNISAGNPDLKPQRVTSSELGYAYTHDPLDWSATLYYRISRDTVTDYAYFVDDNLLLTTKRNSGNGRSGGLDYMISGKWKDKLAYTLSLNGFYAELESADLDRQVRQSGLSYTGNVELSYESDDKNSFAISSDFQGRSLTSQGIRGGYGTVDLSWKHNLTPRLTFVIRASDIGNGARIRTLTRTSSILQNAYTQSLGRVVFFGLNWRFSRQSDGKPYKTAD